MSNSNFCTLADKRVLSYCIVTLSVSQVNTPVSVMLPSLFVHTAARAFYLYCLHFANQLTTLIMVGNI